MLFLLVESCLPAEILHAWERYVGYSSDESGKKDLDSHMKFLSIEVSSEDRIKLPSVSEAHSKVPDKSDGMGCMSSHGVGRLHIVSRTVKAMDYIEILQNKLLPNAKDLFGNQSWIFSGR
ncbi:hypothetical protein TNCV_1570181 [Trichonephila clavipes]|uniref:Uncharacterized protein n=1 Tax=Trichonephila clavipes TaxID=2585209 RepID=A0A8X6SP97_TRICX|nr:hypothetical protein TNCV_1570181 [Trichonephila clavipes]